MKSPGESTPRSSEDHLRGSPGAVATSTFGVYIKLLNFGQVSLCTIGWPFRHEDAAPSALGNGWSTLRSLVHGIRNRGPGGDRLPPFRIIHLFATEKVVKDGRQSGADKMRPLLTTPLETKPSVVMSGLSTLLSLRVSDRVLSSGVHSFDGPTKFDPIQPPQSTISTIESRFRPNSACAFGQRWLGFDPLWEHLTEVGSRFRPTFAWIRPNLANLGRLRLYFCQKWPRLDQTRASSSGVGLISAEICPRFDLCDLLVEFGQFGKDFDPNSAWLRSKLARRRSELVQMGLEFDALN